MSSMMTLLRKFEVRQTSYISLHYYCLGGLIREVTVQVVGSVLKNMNLFGARSNSSSHDTRDIKVSLGPHEAFEEGSPCMNCRCVHNAFLCVCSIPTLLHHNRITSSFTSSPSAHRVSVLTRSYLWLYHRTDYILRTHPGIPVRES